MNDDHLGPIQAILWTIIVAIAAYFIIDVHAKSATAHVPDAISTVRIDAVTGMGSGVHIGNGYILTAGHVASLPGPFTAEDSQGVKREVEILWANPTYDVALLHVDNYEHLQRSHLACFGGVHVGDPLRAVGNPLGERFVSTWGHVSSLPAEHGLWKEAFVANLPVIPGMSGGPVFGAGGEVVGLGVGYISLGQYMLPLSFVVPAKVICMLMGNRHG